METKTTKELDWLRKCKKAELIKCQDRLAEHTKAVSRLQARIKGVKNEIDFYDKEIDSRKLSDLRVNVYNKYGRGFNSTTLNNIWRKIMDDNHWQTYNEVDKDYINDEFNEIANLFRE